VRASRSHEHLLPRLVNKAIRSSLLQARGDDLTALSATAARIRDAGLEAAGRPEVITYSRKVFIPLTRLCRDTCHYCTFVTVPGRLRRDG
jgi:FO synthase